MTNKITVVASEVRLNDHVYNGTGTNTHPTFAWETVTDVRVEDGLILLITGNAKGPHGEFWLEPDEQIVVIRYPEPAAGTTPANNANAGHKHSQWPRVNLRDKLIGRSEGYIVNVMKNRLYDFLRLGSCCGLCGKEGGMPSEDLWKGIVTVEFDTTDYEGHQFDAQDFESTRSPRPEKKLTEDVFAEASDEVIDSDEFQLLSQTFVAKSRSDRVVILGCKPREADAVQQELAGWVRAAISHRMGRLAE